MRLSENATNVDRFFIPSENKNTAAESVILQRGMEVITMGAMLTKEQFDRECGYRVAHSIMGKLRENGLITTKEYGQIEPILARKFSPVWAGFSDVMSDKSA